jgi:hypothetical protein
MLFDENTTFSISKFRSQVSLMFQIHLIAFKYNKYLSNSVDFVNVKNCILRVSAVTAIVGLALIPFGIIPLEVQVSGQQQTMRAEHHHQPNSSSNQSGTSSTSEQLQNTTTTVGSGIMMTMNQTSNVKPTSLVYGVKVNGISIIDNEHVAINLRYDGEGEPPGVSVVVVDITNISSSSNMTIDSIMQNSTAILANGNSSIQIMRSGSNYIDQGWQVQHPNSATVLVQLDGNIAETGHIMVIVFPFLHH